MGLKLGLGWEPSGGGPAAGDEGVQDGAVYVSEVPRSVYRPGKQPQAVTYTMSGVSWKVQVAGGCVGSGRWTYSRAGGHLGQRVGVTGAWAQLEHGGAVGGGHLGHGVAVVAWLQGW